MFKIRNIPNILTTFRIIIIPIIVVSFYVKFELTNILVASLFLIASITDFFDGYLARAMNATSNFGKCIDPIADKLLVSVTLIMIASISKGRLIVVIPVLIIISREIMVSGLREFLAGLSVTMPVTNLAKWKTGVQMTAITILLLSGHGSDNVYNYFMNAMEIEQSTRYVLYGVLTSIGEYMLAISSLLTIITGYLYTKVAFKNM